VFWCFKIYCVVFLESFEDAAFALKVNELSGPVRSDSGIHLIYRVA
jgi:parvulin-like peptidyl-prolyl isomerase